MDVSDYRSLFNLISTNADQRLDFKGYNDETSVFRFPLPENTYSDFFVANLMYRISDFSEYTYTYSIHLHITEI